MTDTIGGRTTRSPTGSTNAGGAGSSGPTRPQDAPGDGGMRNTKQPLDSASIDTEALGGIMEGLKTDPKSLDLAMLGGLRDQLEEFESDPENDWTADPSVKMLADVVGAVADEQARRLDDLAKDCMEEFYECVTASEDPRQSMIDDERQFRALTSLKPSKRYTGDAPDRDAQDDERVRMHTTRTRTTMYGARLSDVMFPTNDYPVRIVAPADPKPEDYPGYAAAVAKARAQMAPPPQAPPVPGQPPQPPPPPPPDELVLSIKDYADQSASEMQQWVFSQFDRQKFTKKGRALIRNGCKVGLGLIHGPFPDLDRKRVPKQKDDGKGLYLDLEVQETNVPGMEVRDPFRFFYDMTPTLDECNAAYYVHFWTVRELSDFIAMGRTLPSADKLLKDDPPDVSAKLTTAIDKRSEGSGMREAVKGRYVVVECDRIMRPEEFKEVTGIEWTNKDLPLVKMWISDEGCLKFKVTPLERDWRVPYYNFGIMPKDDTIYWYSVPQMGRSGQKFIDGALNATLFNMAAAAAPMLVANKGQVKPSNERWRVNGMVMFDSLNPDKPASEAISTIKIDSNVEGNLQALAQALAMFDDDTLYEQVISGNVSGEAIAASQLAQIVNLASVFQRDMAGNCDDYFIGPYTERIVWWGNIYGRGKPLKTGEPDPDIDMKGPHVVKPIAATQFVSRDILIQHLQVFTTMASTNPLFKGFVDAYKLFRLNTNLLDIPDINDAIYPRDKALSNQAAMSQQDQGPEAAKMAEVERKTKKDEADFELAKAKLAQDGQIEVDRMNTELRIQQLKVRQALIELATAKEIDFAKIDADIQKSTMDNVVYARIETNKQEMTPSPYSKKD